jgi:hypothetical protein
MRVTECNFDTLPTLPECARLRRERHSKRREYC